MADFSIIETVGHPKTYWITSTNRSPLQIYLVST